jgi:hypothetical protein
MGPGRGGDGVACEVRSGIARPGTFGDAVGSHFDSPLRAATMTMAANASLIRHAAPMSQSECCNTCQLAGWVGASSKCRKLTAPGGNKREAVPVFDLTDEEIGKAGSPRGTIEARLNSGSGQHTSQRGSIDAGQFTARQVC